MAIDGPFLAEQRTTSALSTHPLMDIIMKISNTDLTKNWETLRGKEGIAVKSKNPHDRIVPENG